MRLTNPLSRSLWVAVTIALFVVGGCADSRGRSAASDGALRSHAAPRKSGTATAAEPQAAPVTRPAPVAAAKPKPSAKPARRTPVAKAAPKPDPKPQPVRFPQYGVASYYAHKFHGRKTANGERFDMNGISAAHNTLPLGTVVRVVNLKNGRSIELRINDRGPFVDNRVIDLSLGAAKKLGMVHHGLADVMIDIVKLPPTKAGRAFASAGHG